MLDCAVCHNRDCVRAVEYNFYRSAWLFGAGLLETYTQKSTSRSWVDGSTGAIRENSLLILATSLSLHVLII
jgi:hypothetical protein